MGRAIAARLPDLTMAQNMLIKELMQELADRDATIDEFSSGRTRLDTPPAAESLKAPKVRGFPVCVASGYGAIGDAAFLVCSQRIANSASWLIGYPRAPASRRLMVIRVIPNSAANCFLCKVQRSTDFTITLLAHYEFPRVMFFSNLMSRLTQVHCSPVSCWKQTQWSSCSIP